MPPKTNKPLETGTRIALPLIDGTWVACQLLDWVTNAAFRCAVYKFRDADVNKVLKKDLRSAEVIGTAIALRTRVTNKTWPTGEASDVVLPRESWPYEDTAQNGWVGATIVDAVLLEAFANAYFGLTFWDDWHDPNYLSEFLMPPRERPGSARLKKS